MKFLKKKHSKTTFSLRHQKTNYLSVNKTIRMFAFLFLTFTILLSSCSKDDDEPTEPSVKTVKDIYICGTEKIGITKVATYWKNGVATTIVTGTVLNSQANGMFITTE